MLFYFDPLQKHATVRGEVKNLDESVLPVTKKEGKGKRKRTIGPRMKNGDEKTNR